MGHRFSKAAANNIAPTAGQQLMKDQELSNQTTTIQTNTLRQQQPFTFTPSTQRIPIPVCNNNNNNTNTFVGPTINLQIQESPSGLQATAIGSGVTTATCLQNTSTTPNVAATTAATGILSSQSTTSLDCSSNSLTSVNNLSCGRQIIIKIQLAKMENGNEITTSSSSTNTARQDISLEALTADCNLNSTEFMTATSVSGSSGGAAQFLNLTLNSNSGVTTPTTLTNRTAGSSALTMTVPTTNNNYLNPSSSSSSSSSSNSSTHFTSSTDAQRERLGRLNTLNEELVEQNIVDIVEYCEVLQDQQQQQQQSMLLNSSNSGNQVLSLNEEPEIEANVCCRRKSKSLAANGGAASSTSKRRCRKCSCRDAFRRILDPSLSRSSNKAQKQQQQQQQQQLERERKERHSVPSLPSNRILNPSQMQRNSMHSTTHAMATQQQQPLTAATFVVPTQQQQASMSATTTAAAGSNAVWNAATATNGNDVILPLATPPQFVVVQCAIVNPTPATNVSSIQHSSCNGLANLAPTTMTPNSSFLSLSHNSNNSPMSPASLTNEAVNAGLQVPRSSLVSSTHSPSLAAASTQSSAIATANAGPIVHSHVDFVHYLVPDLERITSSSFYWGKMDRYEAERLLEGKPEGTFLLRDSAQEEFLFSVTFRKYGRSLHARIEQSGHRFSFDCHDPCVYTAPTVTGLLEHYKDPACVMFFEPMLTIPLHRKNCFSLQQLCRATIVSHTTYDGIYELELPARLRSYLKEYHYKQKLRVQLNEPTYNNTAHCE
ncbi:uncharacterized protein LOC106091982 [Stomoxys calcitrans]|uniref:uncharacterized protein LOC106091982 n=1 Tax=Stomoxys calcitrans TaxID=35570 RepID=UPI0027E21802|nr:uncharacterized protein LOC106091982 [Stomoxys calcitrans]XP_013114165.2 uncharacterized protein LOC106091982 [Stomoxys calcitrans]